jgi:hypothetical protein
MASRTVQDRLAERVGDLGRETGPAHADPGASPTGRDASITGASAISGRTPTDAPPPRADAAQRTTSAATGRSA